MRRTITFIYSLLFAILPLMPAGTSATLQAQQMDQIEANGINLYYERHGAGPALVLIEGLGVGTWLWEKQVPAFSKHFTTIVFDNRGAGKSDKPEGPYSISLFADDLAALLDKLNIPKAHILGVSMGGFVALDFAVRYPQRVDRLVLVSTSAGGADHVPMSQETLALLMQRQGEPRQLIRKRLGLAYSKQFMQEADVDHLIDLRLQDPQPQHAYMAQVMAGASFDLSKQAATIAARTLVTAGDADLLVPIANAHNLQSKLPDSELKVYEDLGHQFFVEIPDIFNRDVIEFLTRVPQQEVRK